MPTHSPQDIELYCKSNKDGKQIGAAFGPWIGVGMIVGCVAL
jgi:hypothetical protein